MSALIETRENREFASEIKFLITPVLADQIRSWARTRLGADPHGAGPARDEYQITSLYFDTAAFDVFHRRGSFGRSKYRIRRYGASEIVFLERKLRTRGLLAKRRSTVRLEDLAALAPTQVAGGWPGYWFHRRLVGRGLQPVCQITYHRSARVAMTQFGLIRLTLDDQLRAAPVRQIAFDEVAPRAPFLEGQVILELKFRYELPQVFKFLIEEFALSEQRLSKYRLAAEALGLAHTPADQTQTALPPEPTLCLTSS